MSLIGSNPNQVSTNGMLGTAAFVDVDQLPVSSATSAALNSVQTSLDLKANIASPTFTGTVSGITKTMVGLANVDNTSDASKPVSTAQQAAITAAQSASTPIAHVGSTGTAHGNATTSVAGFMSSTDKSKLDGITAGAQVNVATNLAQGTRTTTTVPVTSSTGTSATLDVATTSLAGVMSSADKTKLDGIAAGATNYAHPANHPASIITQDANNRFVTDAEKTSWNSKQAALGFTPENAANKAVANGYASLDATGKVPSAQLPGFVDDVVEAANLAAFPATGTTGVLYVALDTNKVWRWSGTVYTEISPSPGSTDSITEGSVNLYHTTARASAAAPVQSVAGKTGAVTLVKADVGLSNVDNTSDVNKPVSTATQTALNTKEATITAGTTSQFWRGDKSWQDLASEVRASVLTGISTATSTVVAATDSVLVAFGKLQAQITSHTGNVSNPHSVTKAQVGLGSVDNTSDAAKPISTATQAALDLKAPLASPSLTGTPTAPTAARSDNSTKLATTKFAKNMFGAGDTAGVLDWNDVTNTVPGSGNTLLNTGALNHPPLSGYYHPFNFEYGNTKDGTGNTTQMAIAYGNQGRELFMRGRYAGVWTGWARFLNSDNYTSYTPSLTGTGASGTWGISVTGNSATATTLQTARTINGTSFNGTADIVVAAPTFSGGLSSYSTATPDTVPTSGGLTARYLSAAATNKPTGTDHALLTMAYSSTYAVQMAGDWRTNDYYVRGLNNGTWGAWDKLYRSADAASANTASKLVLRDASGNFSAGTITAALTGNATTATSLQTARNINGVSFNGTSDITVADSTKLPLTGGTMTGAITFAGAQTWPTFNQNTTGQANTAVKIVSSDTRAVVTTPETLTSPGVLFDFKQNAAESLSDGGTYFGEMTFRKYGSATDWSGGGSHQLGFTDNANIWHRYGTGTTWGTWTKLYATDDSSSTNTASKLVLRDASGNFSAGTITAALTGNATTATTLQTARNIDLTGDVTGSASFNGSANITITATVADNSHNHTIANTTGLQAALDAKASMSDAMAIAIALG